MSEAANSGVAAAGQHGQVLRVLDPSEAYFFLMDRVSCMNIVTMVERESPWDGNAVREALRWVSRTDLILRVRVSLSGSPARLCFVDSGPCDVPFDEVELATSDWSAWVEQELTRSFEVDSAPLLRCTQLTSISDGKACLMLTTHHCISDGRSAGVLVRRLVDHMMGCSLADLKHGESDAAGLPGGMHEVFPDRFRWQDDPSSLRRMSSQLLRDAAAGGMLTELPWFQPVQSTKRPRLVRLWLEGVEFAAVQRQAKQHGVSMHAVLCAAQLRAEASVLGIATQVKLLLTCPVDMRSRVEAVVPTSQMQLYASMIFATYAVASDGALWELAAEVMRKTRAQLQRGDAHYFYSSREVAKAMSASHSPGGFADAADDVPPGTVMSAIGRMPVIESDPLVQNVSIALCSGKRHAVFSAASSYRERMVVNVVFDDSNLLPGVGEALATELRRELLQACF